MRYSLFYTHAYDFLNTSLVTSMGPKDTLAILDFTDRSAHRTPYHTIMSMAPCMHYKIDPKTNVCTLCHEVVPESPDALWLTGIVDAVSASQITLRFDGESAPPVVGQRVLVIGARKQVVDSPPEEVIVPPRPRTRAEKIYNVLDFLSTAGTSRMVKR